MWLSSRALGRRATAPVALELDSKQRQQPLSSANDPFEVLRTRLSRSNPCCSF